MFPSIDPTGTAAWKALQERYNAVKDRDISALFEADQNRFNKFSKQTDKILFDFSKNNIDDETLKLLIQLCTECGLKDAVEAMFSGEKINKTEDRACFIPHAQLFKPPGHG